MYMFQYSCCIIFISFSTFWPSSKKTLCICIYMHAYQIYIHVNIHTRMRLHTYICTYIYIYIYMYPHCSIYRIRTLLTMGWLRLVGSLKLWVSFGDDSLFYRALLQKRLIILRSLLIVATLSFKSNNRLYMDVQ